jgi:hypothetical protein
MSTPPPSEEKRHYATVLPHTLHAVRTRGQIVEFCRESTLSEKSSVQKLVEDWSEGRPISPIVAIDPELVWWHLGNAEEARVLRTEEDVQRFAGTLPHGLHGPLEVIGCNAADGKGGSSEEAKRWLLGVAAGDALAAAAAEALERGITTAALGSATLDSVAAAATARQVEGAGSVRLWTIGQKHSHVFTLGLHEIEAIDRCDIGFDAILTTVQRVFGGNSLTEAARLFFSKQPPASGAAESLVSVLAPRLQSVFGATPSPGPVSFACTGLTGRETWFGNSMAKALGLSYWSPEPSRYLKTLQLNFPRGSDDPLSLNLLGTLHLAATHAGGRAAWHPTWGLISRAPLAHGAARKIRRPKKIAAIAPVLPPESLSVNTPAAAAAPVIPAHAPTSLNGESRQTSSTPERSASPSTTAQKAAVPPLERAASTNVSVVPIARAETAGGPGSASLTPVGLKRVPASEPKSVPTIIQAETSISNYPPLAPMPPAESKPPAPLPPMPIIVRRSGYWPLIAIFSGFVGAGLAGKFYYDAETVRMAADREKRTAAQTMEATEREIAAAVEQVRLASQQAARSDVQSRELAEANAREIERIRAEMEAARRDAVAQARREAEEQTRKLLAPQLELARAAVSPGILKIASLPPGADVHIDGRLAERAPASIEGLPPGRHSIKLTLDGHVTQELTAEIFGSKTTDLGSIKLERATGAVAVSSSPDQLEFSIRPSMTPADADPLRRGRTPVQLSDLPTGEYVVQFSRPGWPERTERVTIERGTTASVATTFQGGTVRINSSPTGATVIQGGLLLGRTPLIVTDVPPRDVTYELRVPGYEPLKVGGNVVDGRQLELNGALLHLDRLASVAEVLTPPRLYFAAPLDLGRVPRSTPPFITISFVVLPNGSPHEVKVLDPVDKKIEQRAVEAIAKWKFFPGVSHAGYPVKVRMSMPVRIASVR